MVVPAIAHAALQVCVGFEALNQHCFFRRQALGSAKDMYIGCILAFGNGVTEQCCMRRRGLISIGTSYTLASRMENHHKQWLQKN